MPSEARGVRVREAGVTRSSEPLNMATGKQTQVLWSGQAALLTAESSLQSQKQVHSVFMC